MQDKITQSDLTLSRPEKVGMKLIHNNMTKLILERQSFQKLMLQSVVC